MQTYNPSGLRSSLEQLETEKLDQMLQSELEKQMPDVDAVRRMVRILEERDAAAPAMATAQEQAALQRYNQRMKNLRRKPSTVRRVMAVAASAVLVLGLLFAAVPMQAEAETFWEMLQRWSKSILAVINPAEHYSSVEYHFNTDNPGLQQVYDAAVELGVSDFMVPMWLPTRCDLIAIERIETPAKKGICARFSHDQGEVIFKLDVYAEKPAREFFRDDSHYESYEKNGTSYNITRNNDRWSAVWTKDNIECSISMDCQEETLRRILGSIYGMEGL